MCMCLSMDREALVKDLPLREMLATPISLNLFFQLIIIFDDHSVVVLIHYLSLHLVHCILF